MISLTTRKAFVYKLGFLALSITVYLSVVSMDMSDTAITIDTADNKSVGIPYSCLQKWGYRDLGKIQIDASEADVTRCREFLITEQQKGLKQCLTVFGARELSKSVRVAGMMGLNTLNEEFTKAFCEHISQFSLTTATAPVTVNQALLFRRFLSNLETIEFTKLVGAYVPEELSLFLRITTFLAMKEVNKLLFAALADSLLLNIMSFAHYSTFTASLRINPALEPHLVRLIMEKRPNIKKRLLYLAALDNLPSRVPQLSLEEVLILVLWDNCVQKQTVVCSAHILKLACHMVLRLSYPSLGTEFFKRFLLSQVKDDSVCNLLPSTAIPFLVLPETPVLEDCCLSSDGKIAAVVTQNGNEYNLTVVNCQSGKIETYMRRFPDFSHSNFYFSAKNNYIVVGSTIYDRKNKFCYYKPIRLKSTPTCMSEDEDKLIFVNTIRKHYSINIFSYQQSKVIYSFDCCFLHMLALKGNTLIAASPTHLHLIELAKNSHTMRTIAFETNYKILAIGFVGSNDIYAIFEDGFDKKYVIIYDYHSGKEKSRESVHAQSHISINNGVLVRDFVKSKVWSIERRGLQESKTERCNSLIVPSRVNQENTHMIAKRCYQGMQLFYRIPLLYEK